MDTTRSELILPIVHLNGTSRDSLIEERSEAIRAARELFNKLRAMSPNGRDYYPQPGLITKAEAQHRVRVAAVLGLIADLEAEVEALDLA